MTVNLYNCSDAINVLNKTFGDAVASVTATLKGAVDVDNPTFLLDYQSTNFNYFSAFGRYYYVTSRSLQPGDRILVTGQSDALSSFASDVAALPVLAVRCEDLSVRSPELADNMIPLESDMQLDKIIGDTVIGSGSGMIVLGVI